MYYFQRKCLAQKYVWMERFCGIHTSKWAMCEWLMCMPCHWCCCCCWEEANECMCAMHFCWLLFSFFFLFLLNLFDQTMCGCNGYTEHVKYVRRDSIILNVNFIIHSLPLAHTQFYKLRDGKLFSTDWDVAVVCDVKWNLPSIRMEAVDSSGVGRLVVVNFSTCSYVWPPVSVARKWNDSIAVKQNCISGRQ